MTRIYTVFIFLMILCSVAGCEKKDPLLEEAESLTAKGKSETALQLYKFAMEREPLNPKVYRSYGNFLHSVNDFGKLHNDMIEFEKELRNYPPQAFPALAEVLIHLDKFDEAVEILKQCAEILPEKASIIYR
ncbi:MAG: hypothetical protein ABIH42_10920, partial [Planctomycetota bacterium]